MISRRLYHNCPREAREIQPLSDLLPPEGQGSLHRLRWTAMVASVSPNCTSIAESSPRLLSSKRQASALARAVIIAVEAHGSIRITDCILCV